MVQHKPFLLNGHTSLIYIFIMAQFVIPVFLRMINLGNAIHWNSAWHFNLATFTKYKLTEKLAPLDSSRVEFLDPPFFLTLSYIIGFPCELSSRLFHCHLNAIVLVIVVSCATKIALSTQSMTEASTVPNQDPNHNKPGWLFIRMHHKE